MVLSSYYNVIEKQSDKIIVACSDGELILEGQVIEHQFKVIDSKYLLFVSDGEAFEGCLYVYLLSSTATLLDGMELGQAYADGMLQNLKPLSETSLTFEYFSGNAMRLDIVNNPVWSFFTPSGVRYLRSFLNKKYLRLS